MPNETQDAGGATEASASGQDAGPARPGPWWRRRGPLAVAGVLALIVVVALSVLLRANPVAQVLAAVDRTLDAGTARTRVTTTVEGVPLVPRLRLVVADGELEFTSQRAALSRELPGLAQLPLVGERLAPVELRFDRGDVYLRLPVRGQRRWVRVRASDPEAAGARTGPGLGNPIALLGLLQALRDSERLGDSQVDGVPTTRSRVSIDLEDAAARLDDAAARVAEALRTLHGRAELTLDVWIDRELRIRRIRYATDVPLSGLGELAVSTDLDLFDFGVPVSVAPPRDSDLVRLPDLDLGELDPLQRLRELLGRDPAGP